MQIYKTPLREFKFLIEDYLALKDSQVLKNQELETSDLMLILEEAAKLCEETLLPLNQSGDSEGCKFDNSRSDSPCNNVTCVADATSADCREYRYTYCKDKNATMLKDPGCFTMQPYSDFDSWCPFKRKINDNVVFTS